MSIHFGVECGQRWYRLRSWRRWGSQNVFRYRRFPTGFAIGPLMWWTSRN